MVEVMSVSWSMRDETPLRHLLCQEHGCRAPLGVNTLDDLVIRPLALIVAVFIGLHVGLHLVLGVTLLVLAA